MVSLQCSPTPCCPSVEKSVGIRVHRWGPDKLNKRLFFPCPLLQPGEDITWTGCVGCTYKTQPRRHLIACIMEASFPKPLLSAGMTGFTASPCSQLHWLQFPDRARSGNDLDQRPHQQPYAFGRWFSPSTASESNGYLIAPQQAPEIPEHLRLALSPVLGLLPRGQGSPSM